MRYKIVLLVEEGPRRVTHITAYEEGDIEKGNPIDVSKDIGAEITGEGLLKIFLPTGTRFKIPKGIDFEIYSPIPDITMIEFMMDTKDEGPPDPTPPPRSPIGDLM